MHFSSNKTSQPSAVPLMKFEDFIALTHKDWDPPISKKHYVAIFTTIVIACSLSLVTQNMWSQSDKQAVLATNYSEQVVDPTSPLVNSKVASTEGNTAQAMPKTLDQAEPKRVIPKDSANAMNYELEDNTLTFNSSELSLNEPIITYHKEKFEENTLDTFDEKVAEKALVDTDTALDKDILVKAKKEQGNSNKASIAHSKWFTQEIEKGDTLSSIFQDFNIPYAVLKGIIVQDQDKYLAQVKPGQKISFLMDESNNLIALVKELNSTEQIHITKDDNDHYAFKREDINSHIEQDLLPKSDSSVVASETKGRSEPLYKQRGRLVVVDIKKGEAFSTAAYNSGLTYNEIAQITQLFKGRIQFSRHIHEGDSLRVLFSEDKGKGSINAVEFNLRKLGKLSAFRHIGDNKYYDENGYSSSSGAFRRFPVNGRVRISSQFNPYRRHPITHKIRPHNGTDFAVNIGTPIYAPADGVVDKATYTRSTGYYIVIRHRGSYSTVYMHLSKLLVKPGDNVKIGSMIGRSGNTGMSTGPHLHYELRINGRPVNAMKVNLPRNIDSSVPKKQKQRFVANVVQYKRDLHNQELSVALNQPQIAKN